jgi:uncharacterized membrane protein YbhN (UPF0104 family)
VSRRQLTALVGTVATVALLGLLAWQIELGTTWAALTAAHPLWLGLAVVLGAVQNTGLSASATRRALAVLGIDVPFSKVLTATVHNLALQSALPVGAGQAGRVAWLVRAAGTPLAATTAATITQLAAKFVALGALCALGHGLLAGRWWPAAVVVVCAAVLSGLAGARGWLRWPGALPGLLGSTTLVVAAGLLAFMACAQAIGATLSPLVVLAFVPLSTAGAKLPPTLLGLGAREALVVALLAPYAEPAALLAISLLHSTVTQVLPALAGTVFTRAWMRAVAGE